MDGGSWAAYQSALPNEARCGGEPDDDEPRGDPRKWLGDQPVGAVVMFMADVPIGRHESGEIRWVSVPERCGRVFHGPGAYAWAERYRAIMARRWPDRDLWVEEFC